VKIKASGFQKYLAAIRPPDLTPEARDRIRAGLPKQGEIKPSGKDIQKLSCVRPILQYHRREEFVEVKVVDVFQAAVGLHARSFILISQHALHLLDSEELRALAAHELGHDYFSDQYQLALDRHDDKGTQELELRCDAIAILTLVDLGLNPRKLLSGLEKLNSFNVQFGVPLNANLYIAHQDRARFIKAIVAITQDQPREGGINNFGAAGEAECPLLEHPSVAGLPPWSRACARRDVGVSGRGPSLTLQ
jgi:hypothetical protein